MLRKITKILLYILMTVLLILILGVGLVLLINDSGTSYLETDNFKNSREKPILIRNIHLVPMTSDTIVRNTSVLIKNGRIDQIGNNIENGEALIIEGDDKYLFPGLIDMHVHLWDRQELGLYLANGVTTIRNLWGIPLHLRIKAEIENDEIIGPAFYSSSPKLTGPDDMGDDKIQIQSVEQAKMLVQNYHERGYDYIKTYAGITEPLFDAIVEEAANKGMKVVSHPSFKMTYSKNFINEVATIEHAEDIVQQPLGYQLDSVKLDSLVHLMAAAKVNFSPTLTGFYKIYEMLTNEDILSSEDLSYVNPLLRSVDSEGQVARWQGEKAAHPEVVDRILTQHKFHLYILKQLHDAGVNIVCSTDAGISMSPAGSVIHEELQMYAEAGLSNYEVLKTATINPRKAHKEYVDIGSIESGNWANLILIDQNPMENIEALENPEMVFVRGTVLYQDDLNNFKEQASNRKTLFASAIYFAENLWIER